jgi:anti-anti-sigma factor
MTSVRIKAATFPDRCVLALTGDIDLEASPEIVEMGRAALTDPTTPTLVLDLAAVTFIDSTGLGTLIRLRNLAERLDKQLMLAHVPAGVQKVMTLTGLDAIFIEAPDNARSD